MMARELGEADDIAKKLRLLMARYPRGVCLSPEDLALIGWLYAYEQAGGAKSISESDLRRLIAEAAKQLGLRSLSPAQAIQRLMRHGFLRLSITEGARSGYRLTCLARSLAGSLVDEIDYSPEQLNVLLGYALEEMKASGAKSPAELVIYLRHVFLATIREKIERKILAIEEDLEERKREVKRTYSGNSDTDFVRAIEDIEYCRAALSELVDTVQASSACVGIEHHLHELIAREPDSHLYETLEESLDFLYLLRSRVDVMLKDVVQFIRDCIALRSLALTLGARDRLCRIQERILSRALEKDLRMPILGAPRLPRLDPRWNTREQDRPLWIDLERLTSLESFRPPEPVPVDPRWKESFLALARTQWKSLSARGSLDLAQWLEAMIRKMPEIGESPALALWYLAQDWPEWSPRVSVTHRRGTWVPLGSEWMMEAVLLAPASGKTEVEKFRS